MASKRLAALTPQANTLAELAVSDVTAVASVLVTNTSTTPAEVTIYIRPVEDLGSTTAYSYVAANLPITAGQTFETFRFPVTVGDVVQVQSTTSAVNFTLNAVYDNQGGQNVIYSLNSPLYPSVGDIWVSSATDNVAIWTGSDWNSIALNAPAGPQGPTGPQGDQGIQGEQAVNLNLLGTVANVAALPEFGDAINDAYYVESEQVVYIWKDFGWAAVGPLRGPTGPQAANIEVVGSAATTAELPGDYTIENQNEAFYVEAEDQLYVWSGTAWIAAGPIYGPAGPTGPEGPAGPQGTSAVAFTFSGAVSILDNLDALTPSQNDAYYVTGIPATDLEEESLNVGISGTYVWTGTEWVAVPIIGPIGPTGPLGPTGPDGLSAYDVAFANGFLGTEEQWLASLQGDANDYTPGVAGDWDVVPQTIAEALDELAERVRALETP